MMIDTPVVYPKLVKVKSGQRTAEGIMFLLDVIEREGRPVEEWPFHYIEGDTWPMTLAVKAFLDGHPKFKIAPMPPPSNDPADYTLTRKQVRYFLTALNLPADAVEIALQNVTDSNRREAARIDWFEDQSF